MERAAFSAGRRCAMAVAASAIMAASGQTKAAIITDPGFFAPIAGQTTTVTFDVNGAGGAVNLIEGASQAMPVNEYLSQGVRFNQVRWVNDGNASLDAAQSMLGLGPIAIPSSQVGQFDIEFSTMVRAFGLWVINNTAASSSAPTFTAYNGSGQVIESVAFGGAFLDGTVGVAQFGFMGIVSEQAIARVRVTLDAAIFDNLMHAPVPAPGAAALFGLAGLAALRRRR